MTSTPTRPRRAKGVAAPSAPRLTLTIRETPYAVRPIAGEASRAFRLTKDDGTLYDVAQTPFGPECDCPDFIFRRDGLDPAGCKHVRALVALGLIEGREPGPSLTLPGGLA